MSRSRKRPAASPSWQAELIGTNRERDALLHNNLSYLPHFSRYSNTGTDLLSADDPVFKHLQLELLRTVASHRGPLANDPHRAPPILRVHRIERIRAPRLQVQA